MKKEPNAPVQLSMFNRHPTNYQSNVFTESRQEFTELEKKIVTLLVNQLGNLAVQGKIKPGVNVEVVIPYAELTRQHHNVIANAAEALSKRRISFRDEQKGDFIFITPFPLIKSLVTNGRRFIEIKIMADIVPHFAALGQRYTKYDLDIMLSLSSVYAQRMFEIVSMNMNIKKMSFRYLVDELRNILNCPETYRWNDFKVNVLDVAKRELESKANVLLEWFPTAKDGKRIVELEFQLKTAQQVANESVQYDATKFAELSPSERVIKAYEIMAQYQLKSWQKDIIVTEPELLLTLFRLHSEFINNKRPDVKNRNKYLAKSLGFDKLKEPKKRDNTPIEPTISFIPEGLSTKRMRKDESIKNIMGMILPKMDRPDDTSH